MIVLDNESPPAEEKVVTFFLINLINFNHTAESYNTLAKDEEGDVVDSRGTLISKKNVRSELWDNFKVWSKGDGKTAVCIHCDIGDKKATVVVKTTGASSVSTSKLSQHLIAHHRKLVSKEILAEAQKELDSQLEESKNQNITTTIIQTFDECVNHKMEK